MNAFEGMILSAALVTALAVVTVALLRRSFHPLLAELCGSESHGRFWLVYSCIAVVLTSLFGALASVPEMDHSLWGDRPYARLALSCFRSGLLGLLLALAAMALVLFVSISHRAGPVAKDPPLPAA